MSDDIDLNASFLVSDQTPVENYAEVSWEAYRKIERMNPSTLVHGLRSMKRLKRIIDGGGKTKSDAMILGTGVHALLLEPDKFESRFCVMPDFHLDDGNTTKDGWKSNHKGTAYVKAKSEEWAEANGDKEILTREQYDQALHMVEAINANPTAKMWLDACRKEVTLLGEIEGVAFKGRVDLLGPAILDVKTTNNASLFAFGRTFANMHYAFRMAIYRELAEQMDGEVRDCYIIAQEDRDDFDTVVYSIPSAVLDNAWPKVQMVLRRYKECMKSGIWPGVDGGEAYLDLHVPNWAMGDGDQEWQG